MQEGLVFYDWDSAKVVAEGVTLSVAARAARNGKPTTDVVIDVNKPKPRPRPLPPLILEPV